MSRLTLIALTILSTIGCDQVTKRVAVDTLKGDPPISLIGGMLRLEYAENTGAFLGWGGDWPQWIRFLIFSVLVGGVLLGLGYSLLKSQDQPRQTLGLSLILGGGVSNLMDRLIRDQGHVVDFLNVGLGPVRTGIFNVADMAILLGLGLMFWYSRQQEPSESPSRAS